MQSTVTLNISEYNEILINSTICQQYKEENSRLKEELAVAHKQLEELQQPKTGKPPYTVKLDGSEVYEAVKKATDEFMKELEKEELQQPEEKAPTCEEKMGNPKIVESTEEFRERLRAKYPDGVTLINKDDPTRSIRLCDKYAYSIKGNGDVRHVGTIEKQDTENYDTPDELLAKLIQKQGLHATYLQIEELLNRQSRD